MNRQQIIRRLVLGAFTVALALPGLGAAASVDDGGFYDKAQFKGSCEENGGTFTDTEDGNTWCQWDDDSQTVCDEDGQDCHDIPKQQQPTGPYAGPSEEVTTDIGYTETPDPVVDGTTPPADSPRVAPSEDAPADGPRVAAPDDDQEKNTSKGKKGKKGKKGGKGRKK